MLIQIKEIHCLASKENVCIKSKYFRFFILANATSIVNLEMSV